MWNSKAFPNRQIRRSSQSRRVQTVCIMSWKGFPQKESKVISRFKTFKARISVDSFADSRVFRSQQSPDGHGKSHDEIQLKEDREHPRSQQKTARELFNFDLETKSVPPTEKERQLQQNSGFGMMFSSLSPELDKVTFMIDDIWKFNSQSIYF